jgi:hypothetical protein
MTEVTQEYIQGFKAYGDGLREIIEKANERWGNAPENLVKIYDEIVVYVNWATLSVDNMQHDLESQWPKPIPDEEAPTCDGNCENCDEIPEGVNTRELMTSILEALEKGQSIAILGGVKHE